MKPFFRLHGERLFSLQGMFSNSGGVKVRHHLSKYRVGVQFSRFCHSSSYMDI